MKRLNVRRNGGFTLIELLVVIAIIGILSSIILVSLNSARKKANDTRVISDVQQIRTQLEADYNGNYNGDLISSGLSPTAVGSSTISQLLTDATNNGSSGIVTETLMATNTPNAIGYIIYGPLPSQTSPQKYFCMSSDGSTNQAASAETAPASGATSCPTP